MFIRLYQVIIPATCFGIITRPSSGWPLCRCSAQLHML